MQEFWIGAGDAAKQILLPPPDEEVIPGVVWGKGEMLDTAAYWALRCIAEENPLHGFVSEDSNLVEEIGFCVLGGFGIKAELNGAAFDRLKSAGAFDLSHAISENQIRDLLIEPLDVSGRKIKYRFPNQRAIRLNSMRESLSDTDMSSFTPETLKSYLSTLRGIGPKTAAWIVRNHFDCDDVAIIDIHVIRACKALNVFPDNFSLPKDYAPLEIRFLDFARAMNIRPAVLDAVMWNEMRDAHRARTPRQLALL